MSTLREAAQQATPKEQLLEELMDSRVPKTEREHAAAREIIKLRAAAGQALEALHLIRDGATGLYGDDLTKCNSALEILSAALAEDAPETNFGNMAQAVDSKESDHIRDATEIVASVREDRTVEPVGYGVFEDGNLHDSFRLEHEANLFAALKGEHAEVHALYIAPPQCKPLTEAQIYAAIKGIDSLKAVEVARAIERAHGIGGEE